MKPTHLRVTLAASVALGLSLISAPARADVTKDQCLDANGKAQDLRHDRKLAAAREQLRVCADASCPSLVRDDCNKRLDELESAQPTIAFEAKDASGADVIAVKVKVDGAPLTEKLDGAALPVDPGQHVFTFEAAGQPPVTRTLVLTEGEKGRRELVSLGGATAPAPATAPAAIEQMQSPATGMGTRKLLGLVLGGAGVAGLAVGSVFGVMTLGQKNQQQSDCSSSSCGVPGHDKALDDHSAGVTDGLISTVGFIAGGALLVGGAVLFFTAHEESAPTTGVVIAPSVGPGGGGLSFSARF